MWYRFHDEDLRLSLRQTTRLHWIANARMLRSIAPTITFAVVSIVPAAAWVATSMVIARLSPVTPDAWTLFGDRLIDALLIGLLPYLLLQHIAFMVAIEATYAPIVRELLDEWGLPVCPDCGHRLDPADVRVGSRRLGHAQSRRLGHAQIVRSPDPGSRQSGHAQIERSPDPRPAGADDKAACPECGGIVRPKS